MKNRLFILLLTVFALLPASCQSQKELTITSQEESIDSYIKRYLSQKDIRRINGANRIVNVLGAGDSIAVGDSAKVALSGYIFTSSPGTQFCQDTVTCKIGSGYLISGLDNGLRGALLGEQSYIIFSAKYGFYDKRVGIVPAMSALYYNTTVLSIVKAKQ